MSNIVMQLRKVVNHPFLFRDHDGGDGGGGGDGDGVNPLSLITHSGKFHMLFSLLPLLLSTDHRILMFCQMVKVMDLLADLLDVMDIPFYRLDGNTKARER